MRHRHLTRPQTRLIRGLVKRTVRLVAEEESKRNGKARLYGYGVRAVASVANVSVKTASRAVVSGALNLGSLESVRHWTTNRKASNERESKRPHDAP